MRTIFRAPSTTQYNVLQLSIDRSRRDLAKILDRDTEGDDSLGDLIHLVNVQALKLSDVLSPGTPGYLTLPLVEAVDHARDRIRFQQREIDELRADLGESRAKGSHYRRLTLRSGLEKLGVLIAFDKLNQLVADWKQRAEQIIEDDAERMNGRIGSDGELEHVLEDEPRTLLEEICQVAILPIGVVESASRRYAAESEAYADGYVAAELGKTGVLPCITIEATP